MRARVDYDEVYAAFFVLGTVSEAPRGRRMDARPGCGRTRLTAGRLFGRLANLRRYAACFSQAAWVIDPV